MNRISVDGYFASNNEESWGMDWFMPDPEVDQAVRKIVFSTTIREATWENTELHRGNLAEVVRDLKAGEV